MNDAEENPVASGLIALVAVAAVVGLLAGISVLVATRMLGVGEGGGDGSADPAGRQSMYLPDPVPTQRASGPLITLAPTGTDPLSTETLAPVETTPIETRSPEQAQLVLTATPLAVASGEELMLSGTYLGGEGSVLDIWYSVPGVGWSEFPLDVYVSGGIFQTYVQTYKTGDIQWQVRDASSGRKSAPVTVKHS